MVKNDSCLGGASKQNAFFSENMPQKNTLMPPISKIGPAGNNLKASVILSNIL